VQQLYVAVVVAVILIYFFCNFLSSLIIFFFFLQDDFAARTKESVERRDRAEAKAQSSVQDLVEKEQEMALAKAELNDRLTHLQVRLLSSTTYSSFFLFFSTKSHSSPSFLSVCVCVF
jgi:hypothetical protein